MVRKTLLVCGIAASVLYVAMTFLVGLFLEGYSAASQTISELSAIGASTRPLWMLLGTVYSVLMVAFGWIVWKSAAHNRALRVVGALSPSQIIARAPVVAAASRAAAIAPSPISPGRSGYESASVRLSTIVA